MEPIIFETPTGKNKVEIKPWITGGDAEYINQALFDGLDVTPNSERGADMGKMDLSKIVVMNHRTLERFIISVDGIKEKVKDAVLNMREEDTDAVYAKIAELRKKK